MLGAGEGVGAEGAGGLLTGAEGAAGAGGLTGLEFLPVSEVPMVRPELAGPLPESPL